MDKLRRAVVLIIAGNDSGSGFFIAPNLILTNQHVVAKAPKGEVVVVGRGLDRPRIARITAMTRNGQANQRDFALLEVQGGTGTAVLAFANSATALDNVIAAGFPGLLLANDGAFKALAAGDLTAMPELAFTKGQIMARQNAGQGVVTLAHSAAISGGNSGGPLVDSCGNVVGVNSFISVAVSQGTNAGFAQSADDATAFLTAHGAKFHKVDATCQAN
ncbi:MAG: trypsin-like peptidase domain-containing protein [Niveispirillum sp.]|nr:trypsin-like peptidase domain-containing protein [Niveispirillum sp.]